MPVSTSQPVYPPTPGVPVFASWGSQVSEHVIQRFNSIAERDARWVNPPVGSMCSVMPGHNWYIYTESGWWLIMTAETYGGWMNSTLPVKDHYQNAGIYFRTIHDFTGGLNWSHMQFQTPLWGTSGPTPATAGSGCVHTTRRAKPNWSSSGTGRVSLPG